MSDSEQQNVSRPSKKNRKKNHLRWEKACACGKKFHDRDSYKIHRKSHKETKSKEKKVKKQKRVKEHSDGAIGTPEEPVAGPSTAVCATSNERKRINKSGVNSVLKEKENSIDISKYGRLRDASERSDDHTFVCNWCTAAFISSLDLLKHVTITHHSGKRKRTDAPGVKNKKGKRAVAFHGWEPETEFSKGFGGLNGGMAPKEEIRKKCGKSERDQKRRRPPVTKVKLFPVKHLYVGANPELKRTFTDQNKPDPMFIAQWFQQMVYDGTLLLLSKSPEESVNDAYCAPETAPVVIDCKSFEETATQTIETVKIDQEVQVEEHQEVDDTDIDPPEVPAEESQLMEVEPPPAPKPPSNPAFVNWRDPLRQLLKLKISDLTLPPGEGAKETKAEGPKLWTLYDFLGIQIKYLEPEESEEICELRKLLYYLLSFSESSDSEDENENTRRTKWYEPQLTENLNWNLQVGEENKIMPRQFPTGGISMGDVEWFQLNLSSNVKTTMWDPSTSLTAFSHFAKAENNSNN